MADTVQVMMEKMVPELEDLRDKKLFTANEIRQIVDKRREFEYMMKRVPLRKLDALRYIEYELNVEALRKKRKHRLGLQKMSRSDTAGLKRVHGIFDRVLYKHRGSVDLWLQYISFCKTEGSGRVLAHVFTRALQSHPRSAALWIEAASFEFATNLSVDSARVLMQRAIRINKHDRKLWLEYFRLELLYIQKISVRREILQLDGDASDAPAKDDGASVLLDTLPEEEAHTEDDGDKAEAEAMKLAAAERQRSRELILAGAIPRVVYGSAVAAIPNDLSFRLEFVAIADLFGRRFGADLSQFILDACVADFPDSAQVHAVLALRPLVLPVQRQQSSSEGETEPGLPEFDQEQAEQQVVARFEDSVATLATQEMKEQFVGWLVTRLASPQKSVFLVQYAAKMLEQLAHQPAERNDQDSVSPMVCMRYVDFVHRTRGTTAAISAVRSLVTSPKARGKAAASAVPPQARVAELWLLYAQLVLHTSEAQDDNDEATRRASKRRRSDPSATNTFTSASASKATTALATALALLQQGLECLRQDDSAGVAALWQRRLQLLVSDPRTSDRAMEAAFKDAMAALPRGTAPWLALREQFLVWAATTRPLPAVRTLYQSFLNDGQLLPTDATHALLLRCVALETAATAVGNVSVPHVRVLFEKLVDLFGETREEVWLRYIQFYKAQGAFAEANRVLHRATRLWRESPRLAQLSAM